LGSVPLPVEEWRKLQSNHKKTADKLKRAVQWLADHYGIEHIAVLTLTSTLKDARSFTKRLDSINSNLLRGRYDDWVRVIERQGNGNLHAHYVVALKWDVRSGFDWGEANFAYALQRAKQYTAARAAWVKAASAAKNGQLLREEWRFWREKAEKYGLGRTEILPVKSSGEAIARCVGKYVSKHIGSRRAEDKGVRLVAMSKGVKVGTTAFAWNSIRSNLWRIRVREFAIVNGCFNLEQLRTTFGPRWAWVHYETIMAIPIRVYPTAAHARADGKNLPAEIPDDAREVSVPVSKPSRLVHPRSAWHEEALAIREMVRSVFETGGAPVETHRSAPEPRARQLDLFEESLSGTIFNFKQARRER
jgi:hypothetical protein